MRPLLIGFSLTVICSISACATTTDSPELGAESIRQSEQRITLPLSPRFYLEAPPVPADLETVTYPVEAACGTTVCFVAYSRAFVTSTPVYALGTRVTVNSEVLDNARIQLGVGHTVVRVAARADKFFVETTTGYAPNLAHHYQEVDGATGAVTPIAFPTVLAGRAPTLISSTANTWAFAYPGVDPETSEIYVLNANYSVRGTPLQFGWRIFGSTLVPGPNGYAFIRSYDMIVSRINETTPSIIDATPIRLTKWLEASNLRGLYHDGKYIFACGGDSLIYTLRLDANTGVVLDPDDDFNEQTGAQLFHTLQPSTAAVPGTGEVTLATIAGDPVVFWQRKDGNIRGLRIDPTTGLRKDTNFVHPGNTATGSSSSPKYELLATRSGTGALLIDKDTAIKAGVAHSFNNILSTSNWWTPSGAAYRRVGPSIASNGSTYLVGYDLANQSTPVINNFRRIRAIVLDTQTGDPQTSPIEVGEGERPIVASDGTNYMVFWNTTTSLQYRLVTPTGTMQAVRSRSTGSSTNIVSAGHNGVYYYFAAASKLYRLQNNGTSVDPSSIDTINASLVLHDWTPEPDYRTILLVGESNGTVFNQRVRSATGAALTTATVLTNHQLPRGASDGTRMLIVARRIGTHDWNGVFVDPVSGNPVSGSETPLLTLDASSHVSKVTYDGTAYALLVEANESSDLWGIDRKAYVRRFDAHTLASLDAELPGPGLWVTPETRVGWDVTLGTSPGNPSLVVAEGVDPKRFGSTLHGYLLGNWTPSGTGGEGAGGGSNSAAGGGNNGGGNNGGGNNGGGNNGGGNNGGGNNGGGNNGIGGSTAEPPNGEASGGRNNLGSGGTSQGNGDNDGLGDAGDGPTAASGGTSSGRDDSNENENSGGGGCSVQSPRPQAPSSPLVLGSLMAFLGFCRRNKALSDAR